MAVGFAEKTRRNGLTRAPDLCYLDATGPYGSQWYCGGGSCDYMQYMGFSKLIGEALREQGRPEPDRA